MCPIKYLIKIKTVSLIFGILFLVQCTESLPIGDIEAEPKMKIICELTSGQKAFAYVEYLGNVNGRSPRPLMSTDTLELWLSEGKKDNQFFFFFASNGIAENQKDFTPKVGEEYGLHGFTKYSAGESPPKITIPSPVSLDTTKITSSNFEDTGKYVVDFSIDLSKAPDTQKFFFLSGDLTNGRKWQITIDTSKLTSQNPTKFITKKNGLLINKNLMTSNILYCKARLVTSSKPQNINFKFYTVTEDFYRYNFYNEVVQNNPNQGNNPAFAAFNMNYKQVIGSFSAISGKDYSILIE
ncbi:MAG: DUF4249 family protein [Saprospiraceae bacterium]